MEHAWIDVSVPLHAGMVHWPDNPPVQIEQMLDMDRGDTCTVSIMSLGVHTGTHVDSPRHFLREALSVEQKGFGIARLRPRK